MANYAVVLYPDKKGMIRLINLMSGSLMVDYQIKPHITLAVFESRNEILVRYVYKKLAKSLRPAKLRYHRLTRSEDDVVYAQSKRSTNLNFDLALTDRELFPRFRQVGAGGDRTYWVPLTAVAYKVDEYDLPDYSYYVDRVFSEFECTAVTAALVRLDPYTEIYVTKLRNGE